MRTVVRNSFARNSILAERVGRAGTTTCEWCGCVRGLHAGRTWLYRFWFERDSLRSHQEPIADGKLFCSRECCESYTGQPFDETKRG